METGGSAESTPFARLHLQLLAISIGINILLAGALLWRGTPQMEVAETPVAPEASDISTDSGPKFVTNTPEWNTDVPTLYQDSEFKTVAIIPDPFYEKTHRDALYVVTPRGMNDSTCGTRYAAGSCYFFLESTYARVPPIQYVGTWHGGIIGFQHGTFKDENTVSFTAQGGDAGFSIREEWELDLRNGSTTLISSVENDYDDKQ